MYTFVNSMDTMVIANIATIKVVEPMSVCVSKSSVNSMGAMVVANVATTEIVEPMVVIALYKTVSDSVSWLVHRSESNIY